MQLNQLSINYIIEGLKANGIRKVVISPGGTNMSLVKKLQNDEFFTCFSIVDERSAVYFAIGLYLQSGEIIATSCTSAQATRNYIPGLTEAYYKNVPILAITMSKHPRFTYQGYMQAPDQTSLPTDCVKKSFCLPYLSDDYDKLHGMRIINEAMLEVTSETYGPVQLNIPWLDFPISYNVEEFKYIRKGIKDCLELPTLKGKKILIVVGETRPLDDEVITKINMFSNSTNSVVYTNHLSNFHGDNVVNGNLLLTCISDEYFENDLCPDILITIGGQTGDYPLYKKLSAVDYKKYEHWQVSTDSRIKDTYDHLTKLFRCSICDFFDIDLNGIADEEHEYLSKWNAYESNLRRQIDIPFSNAYCARLLAKRIPEKSTVNFAILNSLRVWSWFRLPESVKCYAPVAAFGIDGGTSMLIGESIENEQLCFLVTGDLAFYYDINSLGIRHIKNNVRILVVNNSGGVEFKYKSSNNSMPSIDRYIAAAGHYKSAKGWAEDCGFKYLSAENEKEFADCIDTFTSISDKSIILEVFCSDQNEATAYRNMLDSNRIAGTSEILKKKLSGALGKAKSLLNGK